MIIPLGTDAPIYHFPFATVGMIVVNVLLFLFGPAIVVDPSSSIAEAEARQARVDAGGDPDFALDEEFQEPEFSPYMLALGTGLHPLQWVTHNFLHLDIFHLIGNMIFLWAFGIIVEGKIGWWKFLLVYLGIGTIHGAAVQAVCLALPEPTAGAGASAIIYGLLAICMVWAPKNDISCFVFFIMFLRIFANMYDIPILWFVAFYLGWEVVTLFLQAGIHGGLPVGSALGHVSGAVWGLLVGLVMFKLRWVDCEHWDIFAVLQRREGHPPDDPRYVKKKPVPKTLDEAPKRRRKTKGVDASESPWVEDDRGLPALRRVQKLIENGDTLAARQAYETSASKLTNWPQAEDLYALIKSLHVVGEWEASVPLMRDYCRRFPARSTKVRLKLAQVLLNDLRRPEAALRVLGESSEGSLDESLDKVRRQLIRQAMKMREEGVLELEGEV